MGFFKRKKKPEFGEIKDEAIEDRGGPAFLSYSSKDRKLAVMLAQELTKEGVNIWFDQFEISLGYNWDVAITKALKEAKAFVILISPSALKNENKLVEINRYIELYGHDRIVCITTGNPDNTMRFSRYDSINLDDGLDKTVEFVKTFLANLGIEEVEQKAKEIQSKGYIFISYAEEDSNFVEKIKAFMTRQGYGYWDYRDSARDYHTLLDNELEEVIMKAEATLSILSNNWKKSVWSKKEYHYSNDVGVPVFLLRFEDMEPSLVTAGIPYIDFSTSHDEGFSKLEVEFKRKNL